MGFYFGPNTYLKNPWNKLDFIIVLCTILTWILESVSSTDLYFMKVFRSLRALRPLRAVRRNEGIKTIVTAVLKSIPSLLNVMLIIGMFMLVFGILGTQLLKGMLGKCNDTSSDIITLNDCVGNYTDAHIPREWY